MAGSGSATPEDASVASAVEPRCWVLLPSYLLGPSTWRGVGEVLTMLGQDVIIPPVVRTTPRDEDHITPWADAVLDAMPHDLDRDVVVVGHSAVCPRQPLIVGRMLARGIDVTHMILVNGRFPEDGVVPTERDSPFMATVDALERPDGYLPPWHRWWGPMITDMLPDDEMRDRIFSEAKAVPRAIFDQPIPAPKLPGDVTPAFLALGEMYRPAYDLARAEGWATAQVNGEHLHMVVEPTTVAGVLMSLVSRRPWLDGVADGRL